MTISKDRNGEELSQFDVCRNIHQDGAISYYYYIGATNMAEEGGRVCALFANVEHGGVGVFHRLMSGVVESMEKVPEMSGITREAQENVKSMVLKECCPF